jgi:competence protein ComEC
MARMIAKILGGRVRRAALVISACLGLFGGVAVAHVWQAAIGGWGLWALLPFVLYGLRRHGVVALCLLTIFCFGVGLQRGSQVMEQLAPYHSLAMHKVAIVGRATEDGVYGKRSQLTFGLDHARLVSPIRTDLPGNIKIAGFGVSSVYRGDVVRITGKLYPTRGNNQASISFANIQVLKSEPSTIDEFRRTFAAGMSSALPEPQASFGLGLLIGQRSTLPDDVSQTLTTVGLTHIIAVSGYNLTIMVVAARRLLGGRSKFQSTALCLALITVFLLITGNSPSIVRASIISVLGIAAWYYGREIKPLVLLLTAAAASVLANPLYLWGNVSWYLSFLAFYGVLVVAPLVTKRMYNRRKPKLVMQIIIESSCAQLVTLPYVLMVFGQVSLVALLANVLVVALIPLAMVLCLVAGLAGMFLPAVAGWFAWPAMLLLTYMLGIADVLARVPHALVEHIGFSIELMVCTYAAAAAVVSLLWHKTVKERDILTDRTQMQAQEGI